MHEKNRYKDLSRVGQDVHFFLKIATKKNPILMSESPLNAKRAKEKTLEIIFQKYGSFKAQKIS